MQILAVFSPVVLVIPIGIIIFLILIFSSRAKHKARAKTLDEVLHKQTPSNSDKLAQLERLNKLRESGALSEAEFEIEKRNILG